MTGDDLFSWRDEADAAAHVRAAEEARAQAERQARYAPHGQVRTRRERFQAATAEALRREVELSRLREDPHHG